MELALVGTGQMGQAVAAEAADGPHKILARFNSDRPFLDAERSVLDGAAEALRAKGAGAAIITLGAGGALYHDGATVTHIPALAAGPVVDTTGAGDAFVAGLLVAGLLVSGAMVYFNNVVLPEANYRARNLWIDVRSKRPGFELQPGVFYEGLDGYSILVQERPPNSNRLIDVTIYDYTEGRDQQAVIKAKRGRLVSKHGGTAIDLILRNGEMHRKRPAGRGQQEPRYEQLAFDRHTLRLDLSDFVFERKSDESSSRTDRTTPTLQMLQRVDSMRATVDRRTDDLYALLQNVMTRDTSDAAYDYTSLPQSATASHSDTVTAHPTRRVALQGLNRDQQRNIHYTAYQRARSMNSDVSDIERNVNWQQRRINQYMVEVYKKFSIALACLIFTLIGAPLGLSIRRGGLGPVGGYSLGIFLFYWVTLVQGEKLADRGLLPPWLGMWVANAIMLVVGTWLVLYVVLDLRATPPLRRRLWGWLKSKFE